MGDFLRTEAPRTFGDVSQRGLPQRSGLLVELASYPRAVWNPGPPPPEDDPRNHDVYTLHAEGNLNRVYLIWNLLDCKELGDRGARGKVFRKAIMFTRDPNGDGLPMMQYVCIKILKLDFINVNLNAERQGGRVTDNPYRDILYRRRFQDDLFMPIIEVMKDNQYLYVISAEGIPLQNVIWHGQVDAPLHSLHVHRSLNRIHIIDTALGINANLQLREIVQQLLDVLAALARHRICHRDISPGNLVFLPDPSRPGHIRLVVMDFGYALRIPVNAVTGRRTLMRAQGNFGTRFCMAPEVFRNSRRVPYDALFADLWSVGILTYTLYTAKIPYLSPTLNDRNFLCFISAFHPEDERLKQVAIANARYDASRPTLPRDPNNPPFEGAFELLVRVLRLNPTRIVTDEEAYNFLARTTWQGLEPAMAVFLAKVLHPNRFRRWSLGQARHFIHNLTGEE